MATGQRRERTGMDDADFLIRPAIPEDAGGTRRVLVETWQDTYDSLLGPERVREITGRWHAVEALTEQIGSPDASFLAAEHSGRLIGHAFAREPQPGVLFLSRLYVLPAWQRRGVGTRLLRAVVERHPGAARMRLNVEVENGKGVAFYRRHEFKVVGEQAEQGLCSLRMEKLLR
jgi:ribosomal protein S18 acetylase RimI-like enzyme